MTSTTKNPRIGKVLRLVCLISLSAASTQAADKFWSGATADYTNLTWTGGVVPGATDNAINDHGTGNAVQISVGNPDWTVGQIRAGNSLGNGAYVQNGQTVTALGTNYNGPVISEFFTPFRLGIVAADSGIYTINGGTLNYGNGPLNVGEVGTGTLNINGGHITGNGYFSVNPGGIAVPNPAVITGTAGHGPYLGDFTYFEVGYETNHPTTGLPPAGSTIVSVTQPDHSYTFASSYTAPNAVVLDSAIPNVTITLASPTVCSALSFMGSAGNGPVTNNYTVHYASGAPDTGTLIVPDWFGTGQEVLNVEGRCDGTGQNPQYPGPAGGNPVGNAPYLLSVDVPLVNTDKVVSIDLSFVGGTDPKFATATLMAVSGQNIIGNPFTPLAITGYNEDVVIESNAPSPSVSTSVVDTVNQSNGTNDTFGELHVGNGSAPASGVYNMTGGTLNAHNWFSIGRSGGNGVFNLNGGTVHKTNDVGGNFLIGDGSVGVLNQTNGAVTSDNDITIGQNNGAVGTWNLAGGSFTLHPNCWFTIGRNGAASGTLNMSGGTIDTYDEFHVADGGATIGTINMSGGVLSAHSWFQIGRGGAALLNFTGGTINKDNNGAFIIGDNATVSARVIQTGPGAVFNDANDFWIGNNTVGELDFTNSTLNVGGTLSDGHNGNQSGTFEQSGGTVTVGGEFWVGQASTGLYDLSASGAMAVTSWISIGRNGGNGTVNLVSGSITRPATGNGNFSIGGDGGATGILNQSAGTSITNANGILFLGQGGGHGTWNMNGGTANLGIITFCDGDGSGDLELNAGVVTASEVNCVTNIDNATFNFNGGTLQAAGNNGNFMHDILNVNMNATAVIDSQGYSIGIAQNLPNNGGIGTSGLTKIGLGTLTLAGTNTYTGATLVNQGTLGNTTASSTTSSGYSLADGAGLSVQVVGALNSQISVSNVAFGVSLPTTASFDLGGFGNPTIAPLNVINTLAVNGTVTVNIADAAPALGQIPLIKYTAKTGTGTFTVGTLPTGVTGYISNNIVNQSVDLVISGLNQPRWDGEVSANWDTGTETNWVNIGTGLPTFYTDPSKVLFDDNALGATNVVLPGTVNPLGVTVNNSNLIYTFSGPGKISGPFGLTKMGTNVLNIINTNNYTGPTVVANGTLNVATLANFGTPSPLGAAGANPTNFVFAGGTLNYSGPAITLNRPYSTAAGLKPSAFSSVNNVTLTGSVSGNGGEFQKQGPSQLTYVATGKNDLTGYTVGGSAFRVAGGSVVLDGSAGPQTNYARSFYMGLQNGVDTSMTLSNTTLWVRDGFDPGTANANATFTMTNSTLEYEGQDGNNFEVGDNGANSVNAVFNQNGGLVDVKAGQMFIGNGNNVTGGTATYNLNGGTINEHDWWVTGRNGSTGTFNMINGTLNKDGNPFITSSGAGAGTVGTFNMSNGVFTCNAELWVAENGGNIGTNNFSGTAHINLNNWVSLGRGGLGVMNLTGNAILHKLNPNNSQRFNISDGNSGGGTGILNQGPGTQLNIDGDLDLGHGGSGSGSGTYNMTGGTAYVNGWFTIGRDGSGGTGVFNMSGGQMDANNEFHVAEAGWNSTINMSGGLLVAHSWFQIGRGNGGTATVNLSGGTIHHNNNGGIVLCDGGNNNLCTVNETGGYFTSDGGDWLLGNGPGGGLWNQSSGTNLSLGGNTFIGSGGGCTVNLSGDASWTVNGWIPIGANTGGPGILNISGNATLTKNGNSGNHVSIGDGGTTGTINQTGGTIISLLSDTYLGAQGVSTGTWNLGPGTAVLSDLRFARDNGSTGIMNLLAGGTLLVGTVNTNGSTGTSTFNFNGGTLAASASNPAFMQGLTAANVQSGGAIIDSGVNSIGIGQALLDGGGGGGLTKLGIGTLNLNGVNTYTGTTLVSAGTLGGNGTIAGPVVVSAGATFSPGPSAIGTLTLGSTLSLAGTSTTVIEVNKTANTSDLVTGATSITYGGTLVLQNLSGALQAGDTFTVFSAGAYSGSFSSVISQTPNQTVTWDLSQLAVNGTVKVASAVVVPVHLTPTVSGGRLSFSWPANQIGWQLQHQVNPLTIGLSTNWSPVAGSTSTNAVNLPLDGTEASEFFRLAFPAQ